MTLDEARYVVAHRDMYDDRMLRMALEVIESAERQGIA
jgi:hypothetical protein